MAQITLNKAFAEILHLSINEVHDETSPDNTPTWDSLAMINLVSVVEETFEVVLDYDDLMDFTSFGAVRQMLQKKGLKDV